MASKSKSTKKKLTKAKKPSSSVPKKAPKTMADLLASHKGSKVAYDRGETVEGEIISITPKTVAISIRGKSEGLVTEKAYTYAREYIKHLKVGDKVKAQVLVTETPEGYVILSLLNESNDFFWKKLEKIHDADKKIGVVGKNVNSAGLVAEVFGMSGFIPTSHISKKTTKNPANLVGKNLKVKIIELDKASKRIIFSEKFVSEKAEIENQKKALEKVKIGDEYNGMVTSVSDFGCFVKIPVKVGKKTIEVEGLVHISEMSWDKVERTSSFVKEGDKVKVKILESMGRKLSFSIKQTKENPWDKVEKLLKKDEKVAGEVVKITDFGIFVSLKHGIEGLLHITKIPPGKRFERGQEIDVVVEEIDKKNKKISLGIVLTEIPVGYK